MNAEVDARELIRRAERNLATFGVASPRVDAEILLAYVLGVSRTALLTIADVDQDSAIRFVGLVGRRVAREPLQHIVGSAPFRHLELAVGPGVFVPRPETELLVDAVLAAIKGVRTPTVVDLCSGSGAIALAVAQERPDAGVIAVEADQDALVWLRRNTAGTRVRIDAADVRDPRGPADQLLGHVDAVVSNPPYVPETTAVDPEVRADPSRAVFAGADGLALIPSVIESAANLLVQADSSGRGGGFFAMEHDDTHGEVVPAMLAVDTRWTEVRLHHDLAGRPRFTTAFRTSTAS